MKKLFILTGEKLSGKTTSLANWSLKRTDTAGILQPVVEGCRFLIDVSTKNAYKLEITEEVEDFNKVEKIGGFFFDKKIFELSKEILLNSINSNTKWIIIDEFGPLEFYGKGMQPAIDEVMRKSQSNVIIVIRQELLYNFLEKYNLSEDDYTLFNPLVTEKV